MEKKESEEKNKRKNQEDVEMKTEHMEKIKNAFNGLPENWLLLFIVNTEDNLEANMAILNEVLKQEDTTGIYVTLNRSYESLIKILEKHNIKTDKLFFLDCVTKTLDAKKEEKQCLFLENPQNLTNITIAIDEIVKTMPSKNKSLFIDSMSTLLIYNRVETVSKFMHVLTGKIRVLNLNGVIFAIEKELDPELDDQLNLVVDKTVDLSK